MEIQIFCYSTIIIESSILSHHMYRSIWTPVIDNMLACKQEQNNIHYSFAVVVHKEFTVLGHILSIHMYLLHFSCRCSITCKVIIVTHRVGDITLKSNILHITRYFLKE